MTATQQETLNAMQIMLSGGVPVLLWGDPGTGKTQTVERFAREAGWHMESVIASLHEPTDFGGLPVRTPNGVTFEPSAWARRVAQHGGPSLVFFDEVNTATPATQNALMRVVLEGRVGELHLGEDVRFVAAANPPSQNSGAWDLSAPLSNRFGHVAWPVGVDEWRQGYMSGWPTTIPLSIDKSTLTKPAFSETLRTIKMMQAAFVSRCPESLCGVPETDSAASPGWPSPRSWARLAQCLAICDVVDAGDSLRVLLACALIGEATAVEYIAYLRRADLPDPRELLANPASFAELKRSDQRFAALEAVVATAIDDPKKHWRNGFRVCIEAAKSGASDMAAAAARLIEVKPARMGLPVGFEAFAEVLSDCGLLEEERAA